VGKYPVLRVGVGAANPAQVQQLLEDLGCNILGWDTEEGAEAGSVDVPRATSDALQTPDLYDHIFRKCPDAILTANPEGVVSACNARAAALFGWREEEIPGRPLELLLPSWRETAADHSDTPGARGATEHRLRGVRKDGGGFAASVSVARDAPVSIFVIRDGSARDQLERQFIQAQKMESVGLLAATAAHDFNNALAALRAQLYVALAASGQERSLLECQAILDRCAGQTRGLLAFASSYPRGSGNANVMEAVRDAIQMAYPLLPPEVTVHTEYQSQAIWVALEPNQISHMILNLILNAGEASGDGGMITVKISSLPGGVCRIIVEDKGEGMDAGTLARVFEPFFTTRNGRGTGLGLCAVYWIVEQASGNIHIGSRLGEGTSVTIDLPIAAGSARGTHEASRA
jgi:PAS domain S-box-containing protein